MQATRNGRAHVRICLPLEDRRARACAPHDREDRASRPGRRADQPGARRAGPDGALPARDHRPRRRRAADPPRRQRAGGQWRDLQLRRPARDPGRGRLRDAKRQRDHPASVPHRGAALDRAAGRHVRIRAGDPRAHRRGTRSARHQALVHGAARGRARLRVRAEGIRRAACARCRGDRPRQAVRQRRWHACMVPHAAGCGRAGAGRGGGADLARAAPGAGDRRAQVAGGGRRGRRVPLGRSGFRRSSRRSRRAPSTGRSRPSRSVSPAVPTSPPPAPWRRTSAPTITS